MHTLVMVSPLLRALLAFIPVPLFIFMCSYYHPFILRIFRFSFDYELHFLLYTWSCLFMMFLSFLYGLKVCTKPYLRAVCCTCPLDSFCSLVLLYNLRDNFNAKLMPF
jgi:hypothetical protein